MSQFSYGLGCPIVSFYPDSSSIMWPDRYPPSLSPNSFLFFFYLPFFPFLFLSFLLSSFLSFFFFHFSSSSFLSLFYFLHLSFLSFLFLLLSLCGWVLESRFYACPIFLQEWNRTVGMSPVLSECKTLLRLSF